MPADLRHTIHSEHHHFGWDNANEPVLTVAPGDTVEFDTVDASGVSCRRNHPSRMCSGSTSEGSTRSPALSVSTGPSRGALKVRIESFTPSGWGWTAVIPGFGLLADQFPEPELNVWRYDTTESRPPRTGQAVGCRSSPSAGPSE